MKNDLSVSDYFAFDEAALSKHGLSPAEWQRFRALERRQADFHAWLRTHKKVRSQELRALELRTSTDAQEWAAVARLSQIEFNAQHERGAKRWMKKYQDFSTGVVAFIDQIGPVLEVVKCLGDPSTALAIGTICSVFVLASRKNAIEQQAWAIVDGIKDRLPGFQLYQDIYNDDSDLSRDLRKKIVLAYMSFVELCMEISRYCLQTSLRRFGSSVFVSARLTDLNDDVNNQMSAIRMRCEELQASRIDDLKHLNEDLSKKLEASLEKLQRLESERASSHITEIQQHLGLGDWTPLFHRESIDHYSNLLEADRRTETIFEQMRIDNIEHYRKGADFSAWERKGESTLHVVIAHSHDFISYGRHHCWFSPVALDVEARLHRHGLIPHAAFIFRPPNSDTTIFEAIPSVLIQLLRSVKGRLVEENEKRERLLASVRTYGALATPGAIDDDGHQIWHDKLEALAAVASQVFRFFGKKETVYIVLDRADQCCARDQHGLFVVLHKILEEASCVVKILVVAGNVGWTLCERDVRCPHATTLYRVKHQKCLVPAGY